MTELAIGNDGTVRLDGDLTVSEVPERYRQSLAWKPDRLPEKLDLGGLGSTDSSAVALLLEWASWAAAAGQRIAFVNPPEGLRTIAGLSDVEALLGWEDS